MGEAKRRGTREERIEQSIRRQVSVPAQVYIGPRTSGRLSPEALLLLASQAAFGPEVQELYDVVKEQ